MAEATKQATIQGGIFSEIKTVFSLSKTQKTLQFFYGCMLGLVLFAIFLAFSPSSNSSNNNTFYSLSSFNTSSFFSQQSYNSIFSHFFPNSSQITPNFSSFDQKNETQIGIGVVKQNQSVIEKPNSQISPIEVPNSPIKQNQSSIEVPNSPIKQNQSQMEVPNSPMKHNQSSIEVPNSPIKQNQSAIEVPKSPIKQNQSTIEVIKSPIKQNHTTIEVPKSPIGLNSTETLVPKSTKNSIEKKISEKSVSGLSNLTWSLVKEKGSENLVNGLMNCDLFDGEWVKEDSYPLYKPGSCSLIDEQFNCFRNGRPDNGYYKLKWKPKRCSIPRLNGTHMLEMLRGKRLVYVGDSLNRNMWESLVCILRNSVKDQSKVYEASGRHHFRTEPSYSFVFKDYDCTIEFFVSPFLVQEWETVERSGSKKETLRLDLVGRSSSQYKTADILVFNTGHWWTHEKTAKGKDYYQIGKQIYHELNVIEAFQKALTTWGKWVDANVNPKKTHVFFRGYSASHFSGGQWNSGGQCDHETEPIKNTTYLARYPPKMTVLEQVLNNMKTRVSYLNITRLTDYRKDGHPSLYRKQSYTKEELKSPLKFQDCSHWCLPGVPDAWNELLYAELLVKQNQKKQK